MHILIRTVTIRTVTLTVIVTVTVTFVQPDFTKLVQLVKNANKGNIAVQGRNHVRVAQPVLCYLIRSTGIESEACLSCAAGRYNPPETGEGDSRIACLEGEIFFDCWVRQEE